MNSHINITDSEIANGDCLDYCYGSVSLYSSDFVLDNLTLFGNKNNLGGGLYILGNYRDKTGALANKTVTNCNFHNNTAEKGGGLYIENAIIDLG